MENENTTTNVETVQVNDQVVNNNENVNKETLNKEVEVKETQVNKEVDQNIFTGEFEKTGNINVDFAAEKIKEIGVSNNAIEAAYNGEFDLLKAELAVKGQAGTDQLINLLEKGYKELTEEHQKKIDTANEVISSVFNDVEYQGKVFDWAKANADETEKQVLNELLDSFDPFKSKIAAIALKQLYDNANGKIQEPASAFNPNEARVKSGVEPLSEREFAEKVRELEKRIGGSKVYGSHEYELLKQRRLAGMKNF